MLTDHDQPTPTPACHLPHTHPYRTERIQPLNLKDGVTLRRRLPLDGTEGHAKLEVRANLCLPEPEVRFVTVIVVYGVSMQGFIHSLGVGPVLYRLPDRPFSLPTEQIEYSTDKKRLIMGTGDIQLSIDELNLCLEY